MYIELRERLLSQVEADPADSRIVDIRQITCILHVTASAAYSLYSFLGSDYRKNKAF